jgi:hypothetical protein
VLDALDAPVRVARACAVVVRLRRRLGRAHEVTARVGDQNKGDAAAQHGRVVVRVSRRDALLAREAERTQHVRCGMRLARDGRDGDHQRRRRVTPAWLGLRSG